jgi:hypothetical protein
LEKIKDDFGSVRSVASKDVNLASVFPLIGSKKPWDLVMSFLMVDSSLSISVTHQSQKYSSTLSSIFFKFTDGTILKKETPSTSGQYNTGMGYEYKWTGFDITKDELSMFASKDLLKFQAEFKYFPDYPLVEEDIKSKSAEKIRKDATCLLNEYKLTSKTAIKNDVSNDYIKYECKYTRDVVDPFTKIRIVDTQVGTLYDITDGPELWINAVGNNSNGVNGIQFEWGMKIPDNTTVDQTKVQSAMKFDQVDLLLENEKIVSFSDKADPKFVHRLNLNISYKLFPIADSTCLELTKSPVKNIRLLLSNEVVDLHSVDKKYSKSVINVINCINALGLHKSP